MGDRVVTKIVNIKTRQKTSTAGRGVIPTPEALEEKLYRSMVTADKIAVAAKYDLLLVDKDGISVNNDIVKDEVTDWMEVVTKFCESEVAVVKSLLKEK